MPPLYCGLKSYLSSMEWSHLNDLTDFRSLIYTGTIDVDCPAA